MTWPGWKDCGGIICPGPTGPRGGIACPGPKFCGGITWPGPNDGGGPPPELTDVERWGYPCWTGPPMSILDMLPERAASASAIDAEFARDGGPDIGSLERRDEVTLAGDKARDGLMLALDRSE